MIEVSRELLESLIDGDPCWFDHNGGCQAHGYLSLVPGELCPQAEVKALLAEDDTECSCGGARWVDDKNWQPEDYQRNDPRRPGRGRIPCGFCNHGGWEVPDVASGESA